MECLQQTCTVSNVIITGFMQRGKNFLLEDLAQALAQLSSVPVN